VIESDARRRWNESFPKRLSRIYETAQAATTRETGKRANVLAIGKEAQKRGAIHAHFVVGCETASERRAARAGEHAEHVHVSSFGNVHDALQHGGNSTGCESSRTHAVRS